MSTIAEIEAAIKNLLGPEVDQLARWLEEFQNRREGAPSLESWLQRARGAAVPGLKTEDLMAVTRGEE
jgi:hypothetical protein